MYLISDKDKVKSLIEKAKTKTTTKQINSHIFQDEYEYKNRFADRQLYDNIPIDKLSECKGGANIISKTNVNSELEDYIKYYNKIPDGIRNDASKITDFFDALHDVIVAVDPNHSKSYNYKHVVQICKDQNIEFSNQSLVSVVKTMRDNFMNVERVRFDEKFRATIFKEQNKCCQLCKEKLEINNFQIDHIKALANGGTNDLINLQILCKPCHFVKTQEESANGWVKESDTLSSFNSQTDKVFNSELSKVWAFVEKIGKEEKDNNNKLFGFDINKCRENEMLYNKYNYPLFTVMDKIDEFHGDYSRPGLYYVECNNYFPLRGNGWYSQSIITYCLEKEIIEEYNIKQVIYSSLEIKHDYFNNLINHLYKELGQYNTTDFKFDKFAVNSMIGAFKPKLKETWKSINIVDNQENVFYHYLKQNNSKINVMDIEQDGKVKYYYHLFEKHLREQEETEAPIYNMILELEAIELHKLSEIIKSKGGKVLDLVTDCVICQFENDVSPFELDGINIKDYEFAAGVPKYKLEQKDCRLKVESMKLKLRRDKADKVKPQVWKTMSDTCDDNFQPFVTHILDSNISININGLAGTGKSTLIHKLQEEMEKRGLKYESLAPTNKAARIIKGHTINKLITKHPRKILKDLQLDYMIIDEISMVHEVFYKYFLILQKMKPKLRFIVAGNFDQLLPVNDRVTQHYKLDYYNSPALFDICSGNRLELTKCRRSDDVCFKKVHPDNIKNLLSTDFNNKFTNRHLCFTNKKRIAMNKTMMDSEVARKKGKTSLQLDKLSYDKNSQDVRLLAGTPIISTKNSQELEIYNNETFIIKQIQHSKQNILIEDDAGNTKDIQFDDFQKLFYVAYCITIHKCQGESYDHDYTIHEWSKLDSRLKYVALSRTKQLEYINVL